VVPQVVEEGRGVSVQALVPLQVRVMQSVDVQVIDVPLQLPPEQVSPQVQALLSLQDGLSRHAQEPPALVQR
jgi:hypothetical protein